MHFNYFAHLEQFCCLPVLAAAIAHVLFGQALGAIVADVTKVSDLVDGITKASQEQAHGVDQVNTALSQMDKVTQQNASGAEESASAAEELASQAQSVKSIVEDLAAVIGGERIGGAGTSSGKAVPKDKIKNRPNVHAAHPRKAPKAAPVGVGVGSGTDGNDKTRNKVTEEFMSLDDKDLKGL